MLLVEGAAALCTCRKECNKYDLTATRVSHWPIIMICAGGLLLVVPHLLEVPVAVLWVDCHLLNLKKQRFLELKEKLQPRNMTWILTRDKAHSLRALPYRIAPPYTCYKISWVVAVIQFACG